MSITKRGLKWEVRNSLWIVWSFILCLNGVGIFYVGTKVKVKKWCNYGAIYLSIIWAPIIIAVVTNPFIEINIINDEIAIVYKYIFYISWILSIIHSFVIRKEFLFKLEKLEDEKREQTQRDIKENDPNKSNDIINIEKSRDIIETKKADVFMTETSTLPPEIPNIKKISKKSLLNINLCTEGELAELTGVGIILAKKAVKIRSEKGSFASVDEFIEKLNINPHYAKNLEEMLCCGSVQANEKPETFKVNGRMVDY